ANEGISIAMIFLLLFIFKININKPDGGTNSLINIQWGNNKTIAYGIFLLNGLNKSHKSSRRLNSDII
ncbi:hypothetical protein, partial [Klebsiella variicola]|uniref:hypothetical protein n=1 Tax=Klebsiella variicola TaxID=244366 RepID=UPI001953888A